MIKHTFLFLLSLIIILKLNAQGFAPVEFVENKGQWDPSIKMKGDFGNVSFYLNENGYSIYMHNKEDYTRLLKTYFGHDDGALNNNKKSNSITLRSHLYRVNFENANEKIQLVPEKVLTGFSNYFLGNDPTKWASGCKHIRHSLIKMFIPELMLEDLQKMEN